MRYTEQGATAIPSEVHFQRHFLKLKPELKSKVRARPPVRLCDTWDHFMTPVPQPYTLNLSPDRQSQ